MSDLCMPSCSVFLPPPDAQLELHDLTAEARLFRSREAGASGRAEACPPNLLVSPSPPMTVH
jgi:hypothetical protein